MAKILLVEDEEKISKIVSQRLRDDGFLVECALDGLQAINLFNVEKYDLVILDLMLPKCSGIDVLIKIRQSDKKIPVIALTAKDTIGDKVTGLDKGFDDYLTKPFAYDELVARIRALLRRSTNGEVILSIDSLTLDPAKKEVKRKGKLIQLTLKEYMILEYLLRHKGFYINENELLEKIWDRNYDGLSNTVAVHIKNLKRKIEKDYPKEKCLILNERNKGYKINE